MIKKYDRVLYKELVDKKSVSKKVLDSSLEEVKTGNKSLQELLVEKKVIPESKILQIFAEVLNIPYISLTEKMVDKKLVQAISPKIIFYYRFMPLEKKYGKLIAAVSAPLEIREKDEIRAQLGCDVDIVLAESSKIQELWEKNYPSEFGSLDEIVSQDSSGTGEAGVIDEIQDLEKQAGDATVIRLVNQIILDAYRKRATDVHIEPYRDEVVLRYRIDGVLHDAQAPRRMKQFLPAIISRIKIMTNLNVVEHRLPQDGRAIVKVKDENLDLRVSIIPVGKGESAQIRILRTKMTFSLEKLGLSESNLKLLEGLIYKPHGIIFVSGPTGSGKTTTLYSCLSKINTKDRKIITIEDPVEYEMSGITQIQVNPETGLDFSRGLRSILRHDPDIIMVGEVRDSETAEISIRMALTGHLVFSTLHTNNAAGGIARLLDIGIEPYLVSSGVEAFMAQRLVRVICPHCKHQDKNVAGQLKEEIARDLGLDSSEKVKVFRGKGCKECNDTGFFGRIGIYEILTLSGKIKDLILERASTSKINKVALSEGMQTLRQDGWSKVIEGLTTPEEVIKITPSEGRREKKAGSLVSRQKKEEEGSERRNFIRLSARVNIRYHLFEPGEKEAKKEATPEHLSVTENISAGGLLFVCDEPLPVSSIIELNLEFPEREKAIECLAKILRVEQRGDSWETAVCFLDMESRDRAFLERYAEREEADT